MEKVVAWVNQFVAQNPLPEGISLQWSGLTYINKVWQDTMVIGMLQALLGGFVVVFLLMVFLFRSPLLAAISMMPLTFAIVLTYGLLGFVGKSYDMPLAVLSSLALGLSIDYAIHFCQRFKHKVEEHKSLDEANVAIFGEPATAIARNAIVIVIGFLPLVFASLTPYMTVGILFATLMGISGVTTLIFLPALMRMFGRWLFRKQLATPSAVRTATAALLAVSLLGTQAVIAQTPSADEMMQKSHRAFFYAGDDMRANVHMRLIDAKGKERVREMTMLRKDLEEGGDQRYFIHFSQPNDVRNMTFMVWKYPAKDDDRWLYVPAIKMVRRIAAKDENSSFVGSDFTYEDVSGRELEADTYELIREETLNDRACYVVKSTPKDAGRGSYQQKLSWIDKEHFLPLKEEYTDQRGKLHRVFTIEEVTTVNGIPTAAKRVMKNMQNQHRTEVVFSEVAYNNGLPDDLFTERSLQNAPRQWIR